METQPQPKLDPETLTAKEEKVSVGGVRGLNRKVIIGGGSVLLGVCLLLVVIQVFASDAEREMASEEVVASQPRSGNAQQVVAFEKGAALFAQQEQREKSIRDQIAAKQESYDSEYASATFDAETVPPEIEAIRQLQAELKTTENEQPDAGDETPNPWEQARQQADQQNAQAYFQESFSARRSGIFANVTKSARMENHEQYSEDDPQKLQREVLMAALQSTRTPESIDVRRQEPQASHELQIYKGNNLEFQNPNRLRAAMPYSVQAGTLIRIVLETGINSDLPGLVTARIQSPVYDSVTGGNVLIPSGSKIIGEYQSTIGYAQSRVAVAWQRLILPNGESLSLGGIPTTDLAGQSGAVDTVDMHWRQLLGAAAFSGAVSAGAGVAAGPQSSFHSNPGQGALKGFGEDVAESGSKIVDKQLNVEPTIRIRPGTQLAALIREDLVLKPYIGP